MDKTKLKSCPFCGGAGHVYEDGRLSSKPYGFPKWYITCKKMRGIYSDCKNGTGRKNMEQEGKR